MLALKAHVRNGRIVLDAPTGLPEGTGLELLAVHVGDELGEEERAALHAALDEGLAGADAGDTVDADEVLASLGERTS